MTTEELKCHYEKRCMQCIDVYTMDDILLKRYYSFCDNFIHYKFEYDKLVNLN